MCKSGRGVSRYIPQNRPSPYKSCPASSSPLCPSHFRVAQHPFQASRGALQPRNKTYPDTPSLVVDLVRSVRGMRLGPLDALATRKPRGLRVHDGAPMADAAVNGSSPPLPPPAMHARHLRIPGMAPVAIARWGCARSAVRREDVMKPALIDVATKHEEAPPSTVRRFARSEIQWARIGGGRSDACARPGAGEVECEIGRGTRYVPVSSSRV